MEMVGMAVTYSRTVLAGVIHRIDDEMSGVVADFDGGDVEVVVAVVVVVVLDGVDNRHSPTFYRHRHSDAKKTVNDQLRD